MINLRRGARGVVNLMLFSMLLLSFLAYPNKRVEAAETTIVINPGHGGVNASGRFDPGAVAHGFREVDLNNALAVRIVGTLRSAGYNAILSHPIPENPGYPTLITGYPDSTTVCDAANRIGADLFISVHHNSAGNATASGYELYWSSYHPSIDTDGIYQKAGLWGDGSMANLDSTLSDTAIRSRDLAGLLNENFKSLGYVPTRNRVVERDDAITRKTSMPSVLIEAGFVSNPSEVVQMADPANQQKMADQVLVSVQAMFGVQTEPMTASEFSATVSGGKITANLNGLSAPSGVLRIYVPTWSEKGGQDDIKWHEATRQPDGTYRATIDVGEHGYDDGAYQLHCYGVDSIGKYHFLGDATVDVIDSDIPKMQASELSTSVVGSNIVVTVRGIIAPNGIKYISVPVWSEEDGQDDIRWYDATRQSDGSYQAVVDIKDHRFDGGMYNVHVYGTSNEDHMVKLGDTTVTIRVEPMTATVNAYVSANRKIIVKAAEITAPRGLQAVLFPIWSENNGQDDIRWYTAERQGDGTYQATVDIENHNYDGGDYNIHAYGRDDYGKMSFFDEAKVLVMSQTVTATKFEAKDNGNYITATLEGVDAPNGLKKILMPVWSDVNGQDDIRWYEASQQGDSTYSITVDTKDHNKDSGIYYVHAYGVEPNDRSVFLGSASTNQRYVETPIMGPTTVTAAQLVNYYRSTGRTYPQSYVDLGVPLEKFVEIYINESIAEGVRAEVAFAQAMHETGTLQFGGDVSVGQFNFAGLGATGGGVPGFDFAAVYGYNSIGLQIGIRGQVQHLKCYASDAPLNLENVDPRWNNALRLRALSVEELAGTWAADLAYAGKVKAIMSRF